MRRPPVPCASLFPLELDIWQRIIVFDACNSSFNIYLCHVCPFVRCIRSFLAYHGLSLFSGKSVALAILDAGLDNLRLPLVRPPSPVYRIKIEVEGEEDNTRRESVPFLASRLFEWVGELHAGERVRLINRSCC